MGTKYTTQTISGYNASPPADDGSEVESNKVKWATHKDKLADPVKTLAEAIDTALVSYVDRQPVVKSTAYTTVAGDHLKTIETSGTTTITLAAVAAVYPGYTVTIKNEGAGVVTVDGSGSETIDGNLTYTLDPEDIMTVIVDAAGGAYLQVGLYRSEVEYLSTTTSDVQTQLDGKQPLDADLTSIAALADTDGNFIVGNGSGWSAESGATVRTSLGLGSLALLSAINNTNWSGTDLAIGNGGTGASTAAAALVNLGLTALAAEINTLDGYTGNTNDLNILSGAAAAGLTNAELEYVKAVTSDIQAQFNAITGANSNITSLTGLTTDLAITHGGTGQGTAQAAIDALSAVSGASTGQVLTKDDSGNASFQDTAATYMPDDWGIQWYNPQELLNHLGNVFGSEAIDTSGSSAEKGTLLLTSSGSTDCEWYLHNQNTLLEQLCLTNPVTYKTIADFDLIQFDTVLQVNDITVTGNVTSFGIEVDDWDDALLFQLNADGTIDAVIRKANAVSQTIGDIETASWTNDVYFTFRIIWLVGTSITWYIDGTQVAQSTTTANHPAGTETLGTSSHKPLYFNLNADPSGSASHMNIKGAGYKYVLS